MRYGVTILLCVLLCAAVVADVGGRAAFIDYSDDPVGELYFLDLDAAEPVRLTENPGADHSPALSPDGRRLAWVAERDDRVDIHLLELGADGTGREVRRLTATAAVESDLSWSADGERLYFSAFDYIDFGAVGLHAGSREELVHLAGTERGYSVHYYSFEYENVEPQSVFGGDYRHPLHVAGLGLICAYEPWSETTSPFEPGLVLIHHALACDQFALLDGEPVGHFPGGDPLLRLRREDVGRVYARCDSRSFELLEEWPGDGWHALIPTDTADCFLGVTMAAPNTRLALVRHPGATNEEITYLTPTERSVGEPGWAPLELSE
ncbi:MAG: hypothetical protein GF399_02350 [Candidatus Coatesbacteria bacterium]|nr:hypothetical protein [Candidatus Coatesbacteria bacterium]